MQSQAIKSRLDEHTRKLQMQSRNLILQGQTAKQMKVQGNLCEYVGR